MDNYKWGVVTMLPDGHRMFYLADDTTRVAIADNSGREPQDTDDGILWLDFSRNLALAHTSVLRMRESFVIPLINSDSERSHTITGAATLLHLAAEFAWPIVDQIGIIYSVTERGNK